MKYARHFTRHHTLSCSFTEKHQFIVAPALAGVAAMCLAFTPLTVASATDLSRTDNGNTRNDTDKRISDVYAGKVTAQNVAVNQFDKFDVSKGDTVNLHFGKDDKPNDVFNLVNFVNDRININGTVNTILNNKTYGKLNNDGNLFFLSKEGMTIGADGVINAGYLGVAVPSSDFYEKLRTDDQLMYDTMKNASSYYNNGYEGVFPLNPSGSIIVASRNNINTNGSLLAAQVVKYKDEKIIRSEAQSGTESYGYDSEGNQVYNIYAATLVPDAAAAVNVFDQFIVDPDRIINMYLRKNPNGSDANINNLVNLVDSRIDINGTINLVKADSSLFFLSPNGLVVGAGGVINAGSFYGMTPTTSAYKDLKTGGLEALKQLTIRPDEVAINADGDITINGTINTVNGIMLRAGHDIILGSAKDTQGNHYKPTLKSSTTYDFNQIVNLTEEQKTALTYVAPATKSANLTEEQKTALSKVASDTVVQSVTVTPWVDTPKKAVETYNLNGNITLETVATNTNNRRDGAAGEENRIEQRGTIDAWGDVKLVAKSVDDGLSYNPLKMVYDNTTTTAAIDIYGQVTGKTISGNAEAINNNTGGTWQTDAKTLEKMALQVGLSTLASKTNLIPINADVQVGIKHSSAKLEVHKDAVLDATGKLINHYTDKQLKEKADIKAYNDNLRKEVLKNNPDAFKYTTQLEGEKEDLIEPLKSLNLTASSKLTYSGSVKPYDSLVDKDDSKHANVAVIYAGSDNNAEVKIAGTIKTKDGAKMAATANSDVSASASVSPNGAVFKSGQGQEFAVGITLVDATNKAKTSITDTAHLDNLQGGVEVTANATNKLKTSATANTNREGSLALAVNRTVYNSSSDVDVAAGITTGGLESNIVLRSENLVSKDAVESSSKAGQMNAKKISELDTLLVGKEGSNSILQWLSGTKLGKKLNMGNWFNTAASSGSWIDSFNGALSVGLLTEKNTSGVHVGDVGLKTTGGDLTLHSHTTVSSIGVHLDSAATNKQKKSTLKNAEAAGVTMPASKVKAIGSFSVLLADVTNDSNTVIDGSSSGRREEAKALQGNNVYITSKTELPDSVLSATGDYLSKFKKDFSSDKVGQTISNTLAGLIPYVNSSEFYKYAGIAEFKFLSPANYANFTVRAMTDQGGGSDATNASTGLSGMVNVNTVNSNSNVVLGKDRIVKAGDRLINAARTTGTLTSINGDMGDKLGIGVSQGSLAGASYNQQTINGSSMTVVAQDTKLTGQTVEVTATNKLTGVGLVLGAGMGEGSLSLSGMVNRMVGNQTAIAAVDQSVLINADAPDAKAVHILAANSPFMFNLAGTLSLSSSDTSGVNVGAGVAINQFNVNTIAGVMDLSTESAANEEVGELAQVDAAAYAKADAKTKAQMQAEVDEKNRQRSQNVQRKAAKQLVQQTAAQAAAAQEPEAQDALAQLLGDSTSTHKGRIKSEVITVKSENTGDIIGIGVAGAASDSGGMKSGYKNYDEKLSTVTGAFDKYVLNGIDIISASGLKKIGSLFTKSGAPAESLSQNVSVSANKDAAGGILDSDSNIDQATGAVKDASSSDGSAAGGATGASSSADPAAGGATGASSSVDPAAGGAKDAAGGSDSSGAKDAAGGSDSSGAKDAAGGSDSSGAKEASGGSDSSGAKDAAGGNQQTSSSGWNFTLAGSGAYNAVKSSTVSLVDDTVLISKSGTVDTVAQENTLNGAFAGSAALSLFSSSKNNSETNAGIAGAAAINNNDHQTVASIRNTDIKGADVVSNLAENKGVDVAGALGAAVATSKGNESVSMGLTGAVAINMGSRNASATITSTPDAQKRAVITGVNQLKVKAVDEGLAIAGAGGVAVSDGVSFDGMVAYNDYGGNEDKPNQVEALVQGLDIAAHKVDVTAEDKAGVYTVAAGGSVSKKGSVSVAGSAATALINKTVTSGLKDTNVTYGGVDQNRGTALTVQAVNNASVLTLAGEGALSWGGQGGGGGVGVGISINRVNEDTKAFVSGGTQKVDDALVKAQSNADITGVGVGVAAGGSFGAVGSGNYNLTDSDVTASIDQARMLAEGSVGVVAQNDDQLLNIAGAVSGSSKGAAGLSVGINRIKGATQATVTDSDITAKGKLDGNRKGITVSEATDTGLIKEVKLNPFSGNSDLKNKRKDKVYTGLVVESSATHDLSSLMGTVAVAGKGAGAGTVNINDISGATSALVDNSKINKNLDLNNSENSGADVNVKAADYTNNKTITGSASGSGGVAVGLTGEWSTVSRQVDAQVTGSQANLANGTPGQKAADDIRAQNFKVQADSQQGMSSANLAAAVTVSAGDAGVAATGSGSWDKLASATNASVQDVQVKYAREAAVTATHAGNIHSGSVGAAVSVGGGAANVGAGFVYGSNQEQSRTSANVTNSSLTALENSSSAQREKNSTLTVKADSASRLYNNLLSVGVAVNLDPFSPGVAISGSIGNNDLQAITTTTVANSTLTADKVDVLSNQYSEAGSLIGGVAGGSWVGVGASVSKTDFTDKVNTNVYGSKLTANKGDLTVEALSSHKNDQLVGNAGIGGLAGVSVNWIEVGVNNDADRITGTDQLGKERKNITDQEDHINKMFAEQLATVNSGTSENKAADTSENAALGVHVNVQDSQLESGKTVTVKADEKDKFNLQGGAIAVGLAGSASGSVAKLKENHQVGVNLADSKLHGQDVAVTATRGSLDGAASTVHTIQGAAGLGVAAGVSYAYASDAGLTGIAVQDTDITAARTNKITAEDAAKLNTSAEGLSVSGVVGAGYVQAYVENGSNDVDVLINNKTKAVVPGQQSVNHELSGKEQLTISAAKKTSNTAEATGVSVAAYSGGGTVATVNDSGNAVVKITNGKETGAGFGGNSIAINAVNATKLATTTDGTAGGLLAGVGVVRGEIDYQGKAKVVIDDGNIFRTDALTVNSRMGEEGSYTGISRVTGGAFAAGAAVAANLSEVHTDTESVVDVGKEIYVGSQETNYNPLRNDRTKVTLKGENYTSRKAENTGASGGALEFGSTKAETTGKDRVRVSAGGGTVKDLDVEAIGKTTAYANAKSYGGGLLAVLPYAAIADNELATSAVTTISGVWKVTDSLTAHATQNDTSLIHGETAQGGVGAVAGAQAYTTIKDYEDSRDQAAAQGTRVIFTRDAAVTANTVDARAGNTFKVKAADGNKNFDYSNYRSSDGDDAANEYLVVVDVGGLAAASKKVEAVQTVNKSAKVIVDAAAQNADAHGAKIIAGGKQVYEASTIGTIDGAVYATTVAGVGYAGTNVHNNVTTTNVVDVKGNLQGQRRGDITLAAWDNLGLVADAVSWNAAALGGASVTAGNVLNRTNDVLLSGIAEDAQKLHLYVGKKADANSPGAGGTGVYMTAYGYNDDWSAGFTAKPTVTNDITSTNSINVGWGSVGNVNSYDFAFDTGIKRALSRYQKYGYWWNTRDETTSYTDDEFYVRNRSYGGLSAQAIYLAMGSWSPYYNVMSESNYLARVQKRSATLAAEQAAADKLAAERAKAASMVAAVMK